MVTIKITILTIAQLAITVAKHVKIGVTRIVYLANKDIF